MGSERWQMKPRIWTRNGDEKTALEGKTSQLCPLLVQHSLTWRKVTMANKINSLTRAIIAFQHVIFPVLLDRANVRLQVVVKKGMMK